MQWRSQKGKSWRWGAGPGKDRIFLREGRFHVKSLVAREELEGAYRLRHRVFAQELRWVPQAENSLEVDDYDCNSVSFGVFDEQGRMASYLRLIMPGKPFMLEREFSRLMECGIRRQMDTAEISRLCVAPEARKDRVRGICGVHTTSMLLFKGVYSWCAGSGIRYLYAVAEEKVYRLFRAKGFPYRVVGGPAAMPDGVRAVAVMMDWREFLEVNGTLRPGMLRWFIQDRSGPAPPQQPRPAPCLPRPASA